MEIPFPLLVAILILTGFFAPVIGIRPLRERVFKKKAKQVKSSDDYGWHQPTQEQQTKVEEVPIEKVPKKIDYEIVEEKDERTQVVKRGKVTKGREFITWKKRDFFVNHVLKETTTGRFGRKKERFLVRWNRYSSEAMDKDGHIIHDGNLENWLMNDMVIQFRDAAITLAGFAIDRPMMFLLIFAMIFGIPIGLSYNDIFHWVPTTVIHWVPRK